MSPVSSTEVNKIVAQRDGQKCVHCGTNSNLTIQHRRGRGMGGSTRFEGPENKILLCWEVNTGMESDSDEAEEARRRGWKIDRADPREAYEIPVWTWPGGWKQMLPDGTYYHVTSPAHVRELRPDQLEAL